MIHTIEHVQEREGEYYVTQTRVPVGVIVASWKRATPPEHIVEQFPSLSLADIYGVITYYLDHQLEMDEHFALLSEDYERERLKQRADDPVFYGDLHQRIDTWRATHPHESGDSEV